MKGFTHYMLGLGAVSCFPDAVLAAGHGNPLPLLAGGLFGILPDALDFKGARFFARHDMEIMPDPAEPDMQMTADGIATAIRHARKTGSSVRVRLRTIPLGADSWQHYAIHFHPEGVVKAALGPVCTTGGRPLKEHDPDEAESPANCRLVIGYEAVVDVAILDGPMLAFVPLKDGRVRIDFIPWHRAWSHSLALAAAAGLLLGIGVDGLTGLAAFVGWSMHILADQLGFLGSALFYPFIRKRFTGFQLARSNNAVANLGLTWTACLLIFWNLARNSLPPVPMSGGALWILAGLLPFAALQIVRKRLARF